MRQFVILQGFSKLYYEKNLLSTAWAADALSFSASAANFQNETLSYVIQYKWGLVQKNAATAKLVLRNTANTYNITMSAQTLPWANSIYPVKDTLISMISKTNFKPLKYIKATHENKKFRKDILTYRYVKNHAYGSCTRFKQNPGGPVIKSVRNCSATGPTYDMVSIFYYIRTLNFQTMLSSKKVVRANIFSGSNPEVITIKCVGVQKVKVPNGKVYQCYNLQFTFTMNGRKILQHQ